MNKVTFNVERCKGCGLCVSVCPKKILELGEN
ncbi:MAG: 4Fe-4S binding protein, partial [Clostridiales bacterium]|nr:4Fe-4S binding protein [Clostridiales bacterium]